MGILPRKKKIINCDFENIRFTALFYDGFYNITGKEGENHPHSHNFYEIFFVMSGNTEICTSDFSYPILQNDVCIIPPGCIHDSIYQRENLVIGAFFFSLKEKDSNCDLMRVFSSLSKPLVIKKKKNMLSYIKKIISAYYSGAPFSKEEVEAFTKLIFIELSKSLLSGEQKNSPATPFVSEIPENDLRALIIGEYMAQNYNKDISLKTLSEHLHLCEKYTGKIIKKSFGMRFCEYLSHMRLSAAKKLLLSDMPLNKIAEETGYKSYNGFYAFFKKNTGISPEEYRTQIKS